MTFSVKVGSFSLSDNAPSLKLQGKPLQVSQKTLSCALALEDYVNKNFMVLAVEKQPSMFSVQAIPVQNQQYFDFTIVKEMFAQT